MKPLGNRLYCQASRYEFSVNENSMYDIELCYLKLLKTLLCLKKVSAGQVFDSSVQPNP